MKKTSHIDLLYRLNRELKFKPVVRELFHTLRIEGNKASHQFITSHKEALDGFKPDGLKVARTLAIWFHQSFAKQDLILNQCDSFFLLIQHKPK